MFAKMVVFTLFVLLVYSVSVRVASPASVMPGTNGVQQHAIHQAIPAAAKKKTKARKPPAEKGKKRGRTYNIGVDYEQAWEYCRQKYGRSWVIRVWIRPDGMIICYID